jgi:hypothetical protein
MAEILKWLAGKKTYLIAIAAGIIVTLNVMGYIEDTLANKILDYLGVGIIFTLRSAISSLPKVLGK